MPKNLVIVESPAKAKTIERFLGKDYKVMSSYGHIRDLRKKNFSIEELEGDIGPIYEIPDDKRTIVDNLKKAAKAAKTVWLASDEDREGEAIAWHLYDVLGLAPDNAKRIVFHEITKNAILHAIENPRSIDLNRVDAQQARRVLDRIVGFELSPVLWKKIKPSLSAGRVQSVAVRLIVEREKEIRQFIPEEYFRVSASFSTDLGATLKAELSKRLADETAARRLLDGCMNASFRVSEVAVKPLKKSPAPPFTTSTLQQEASRKLGFTVSQTMMVAQRLYEKGLITYMRTDSLNLSSLALASISAEIRENLGESYLKTRKYHTRVKGAQEAHEAIRPTYVDRHEIEGTAQEKRLYSLIWKRAVASQMADAVIEKTTVTIAAADADGSFVASGEVIKFDGFLKVYIEGRDDETQEPGDSPLLPPLKAGDRLACHDITATQRFTLHPPRYTEASLVKKMEELGIGRPSTYAPTISTIQQRGYIERGESEGTRRQFKVLSLKEGKISSAVKTELTGADKGKLVPTDIGVVVNDFLTKYFPGILDYNFTANVEQRFDDIAAGNLKWLDEIHTFYRLFHPDVDKALNIRLEHKVGERLLGTDPVSGKPVSVKIGRFGPVAQIGSGDGEEKPQFASLLKGQSVNTITLDEALKLFAFPRAIGTFEDKEVSVAVGRFGPYVKHDGKFVSIPKGLAPETVTLDEAVQLILSKREAEAKKVLKEFEEDATVKVLNGRYGPYISQGKANYKIPKSIADPAAMTYGQCKAIIESAGAAPKTKKPGARRAAAPRKK